MSRSIWIANKPPDPRKSWLEVSYLGMRMKMKRMMKISMLNKEIQMMAVEVKRMKTLVGKRNIVNRTIRTREIKRIRRTLQAKLSDFVYSNVCIK